MWAGPLPPPETLDQFSNVVENGAERIVAAWEKETAHRHKLEKWDMAIAGTEMIVSKLAALIFVLAALGVCAYCASIGANWIAAIIGGGVIGSVVWAFVKSMRNGT